MPDPPAAARLQEMSLSHGGLWNAYMFIIVCILVPFFFNPGCLPVGRFNFHSVQRGCACDKLERAYHLSLKRKRGPRLTRLRGAATQLLARDDIRALRKSLFKKSPVKKPWKKAGAWDPTLGSRRDKRPTLLQASEACNPALPPRRPFPNCRPY
eukprot:tig00000269_g23720.t1